MNIFDTIENILNSKLYEADLRYCLVDSKKHPFRIDGLLARPNNKDDFVPFEQLLTSENLASYSGIGISVQASNISAIDVDHCFSEAFNIESADERAKDIIERFDSMAYIEFSFSGTGLRLLCKPTIIDDYTSKYYIKNESRSIEFYQPTNSYRYVTVTGKTIQNNALQSSDKLDVAIQSFLNDYMQRKVIERKHIEIVQNDTRSLEDLQKLVKVHYFKDIIFQNLWFNPAPGSGSNESERDYHLIAYLYENIVQDKRLLKQVFESSPFFKSKDFKHIKKWTTQDGRYFEYLYNTIRRTKC